MFFHRRHRERQLQEACSRPAADTCLCQGFASAFVTAQDGLTLHVRRYGFRHASAHSVVCLPGPARTAADFHPWRRRWQPILPLRDLCWRSIIAVMASPNTIAIPTTIRFESHSPTSRPCWPRLRSLRPYLSARLLVAYLP